MDNVSSPKSDSSSKELGDEEMQTEGQEETNSPKDSQMKRKRSPTLQESENGSHLGDHRAPKKEKKRRKRRLG